MRIPSLDEIPDLTPVDPGEYDLRVISAKDVRSERTGRTGIMLVCEIVGEENAENVFHRIWMPMESDDERKAQTMWRMMKEFIRSVGLPTDGLETADFENLEFSAQLSLVEQQNGRMANEIVRVT